MNPVEPGKPSRRRDLMNRVVPDNEFTQWRLWSRSCGVADMIAESRIVGLGYEQPMPAIQKDGKFDYERFRQFVTYQLGMSPR